MIINGGQLNQVPLNSLFLAIGNIEVLIENILVTPDLKGSLTLTIKELLEASDAISGPRNTVDSITEVLDISDSIIIGYTIPILESLEASDNTTYVAAKIETIKELILSLDSTSNVVLFNNTLLEIISTLDVLDYGILKTVSETIAISEFVNAILHSINEIISEIVLSESLDIHSSIFLFNTDELIQSDVVEERSIFNSLINDDLLLLLGDLDGGNEYISYLLSPETFSVSTYSNYNFYDSTRLFEDYLFINSNGLFKYGGNTDNAEVITAKIQTAALTFGTSNLKQLPAVYMGLSNSNKLILKVSIDGRANVLYKLNKQTDSLQTQKISIGKGLIGRYFQFELITQENTQFELESLEFYPLTLKRKL